jgi:hypothetical protein
MSEVLNNRNNIWQVNLAPGSASWSPEALKDRKGLIN